MNITIKCIICGIDFGVKPHRLKIAKVPICCSRKCNTIRRTSDVGVGEKFNRLTILREIEPEIQYAKGKKTTLRKVECRCDCGNISYPRLIMVRNGEAKSCGCLTREQAKINTDQTTHGLSKHPIYCIWAGMKQRCYSENCDAYKNYGGRGITVCERWHDFKNFYDDMIDGYIQGLEIERVDNNGIYEKSNCVWETPKIQAGNRRDSIRVVLNGETICLAYACQKLGLKDYRIRRLMQVHNYSFDEAIKVPIGKVHRK